MHEPTQRQIPISILLAEDNPADIELVREAFGSIGVNNSIEVVEDGEEAMEYLNQTGKFKDKPTPSLILLDLNLPKLSGKEVLRNIKNDENLRRLPVVVLTSSQAERDVSEAYNLNANCYITKPVDVNEFIRSITVIASFWLNIAKIPRPQL